MKIKEYTMFKWFTHTISLLSLLLFSLSSSANLFDSKPQYLPANQAFTFSHQFSGDTLQLNWEIAENYYLYKKEIHIQPINAELGDIKFPMSESYHDEFFGTVDIFHNQLTLDVPLKKIQPNAQLEVQYQGCTKGFCYPPEKVTLDLQAVTSPEFFAKKQEDLTASNTVNSLTNNLSSSEQNLLASQLSNSRFTIFWFFILGIGLAFTPCILPMLPLLSSIIIGGRQRPNNLKALGLSLIYVQGMALTYTLMGLIVVAIGLPFQIALQSPPVLITLALLFTLLAFSMFGLFTLELPYSWQQKLNQLSQKQQGGSYLGVFIMGMIAGLVASPCTSAPLSGALLYVAQSGDMITGGLALYFLALGMGLPLILITHFGNRILPKSGDWLLKVKTLFGFVMLALPIFLLTRVIPSEYEMLLWATLAISFLVWLNAQFLSDTLWKKALKIVLLVALILSSKPWTDLIWQPTTLTHTNNFVKVTTLSELQKQITAHKNQKVMFDLYADWCVACQEFEKYTFNDPQVKAELDNITLLQIDMTRNSKDNEEIMKHFQILGLPTILFFDENGKELSNARITGFMPASQFLDHLKKL